MPSVLVVIVAFMVAVLFGWLALAWSLVSEWLCREFIRWELDWNHPESQPWPDFPESRWGPRYPWLCSLADLLTGGRCHD